MRINRRSFLKGTAQASAAVLAGSIAATATVETGDGIALYSMTHPRCLAFPDGPILLHDADHHDLSKGFGLASVKAEGSAIEYDPADVWHTT